MSKTAFQMTIAAVALLVTASLAHASGEAAALGDVPDEVIAQQRAELAPARCVPATAQRSGLV